MHRLVGSGNEGLGVYPRIREWAWVVKTYKACLGLPKVNLTYFNPHFSPEDSATILCARFTETRSMDKGVYRKILN